MRLSIGTAAKLGFLDIEQLVEPTTAYVMLGQKCENGCAFCSQSIDASRLSRIQWPKFDTAQIIHRINNSDFKRVCLQCTSANLDHASELLPLIKKPVSISFNFQNISQVSQVETANSICMPLDAATAKIYETVRSGSFRRKLELLISASKKYPGKITTHLIAGLGETYDEMIHLIEHLHNNGINIGLFAFTPIKGTPLENRKQPDMDYYRKLQAEYYKLKYGKISKEAFETTGCYKCNRPFYNEKPSGPIYNYPRELTEEEYNETNNR